MKIHFRILSFLSFALIFQFLGLNFTSLNAQENQQLKMLIERFPISLGEVVSLGDHRYKSETFGSFTFYSMNDPIYHDLFGETNFYEYMDEDGGYGLLLNTIRWGRLRTDLPEEEPVLGIQWPYVKSDITGNVYYIELNCETEFPFYNHKLKEDGEFVGWQSSIGIELTDAESYYFACEQLYAQMQISQQNLASKYQEITNIDISTNAARSTLPAIREHSIEIFYDLYRTYTEFLWYRHRLLDTQRWIELSGGTEDDIYLAEVWIAHLYNNMEESYYTYLESSEEIHWNTEVYYFQVLKQWAKIDQG